MENIMHRLIDPDGTVHAKLGAQSFADGADEGGLTERNWQEYRFDPTTRGFLVDRATPASAAAQEYVNQRFGSPERLMRFAEEGHLTKDVLVNLLTVKNRQAFLDACASIERKYTEACTAKNDPCLESGCSVEGEDEICLQPLLNAGLEYHQAYAAKWIELFRTPANRIDVWRT